MIPHATQCSALQPFGGCCIQGCLHVGGLACCLAPAPALSGCPPPPRLSQPAPTPVLPPHPPLPYWGSLCPFPSPWRGGMLAFYPISCPPHPAKLHPARMWGAPLEPQPSKCPAVSCFPGRKRRPSACHHSLVAYSTVRPHQGERGAEGRGVLIPHECQGGHCPLPQRTRSLCLGRA